MSSGDSLGPGLLMSQTTLRAPGHPTPPSPGPVYLCVPLTRGPWHLVSLSPEACVTMWPPFIAPDTDLLVGSLLHPAEPLRQAPLRLVAGHQPLARAEEAAHPGNQPVYLT